MSHGKGAMFKGCTMEDGDRWKFFHKYAICPVCGSGSLTFNDWPKGMTTACKECPWDESLGPLREAVLRAILNRNEPVWKNMKSE